MLVRLCMVLHVISVGMCYMSPKVVGGQYAKMIDFPYVVYLEIECIEDDGTESYYGCGSSILNQHLLLTAAHCTESCLNNSIMVAYVGHRAKNKGIPHTASAFLNHENYNANRIDNDIGIVSLYIALTFSETVSRVSIMKTPPYSEKARIAGWGCIDEILKTTTEVLMYVDQYTWQQAKCKALMRHIPEGTICASNVKYDTDDTDGNYPSLGDSGSALVVEGYIQLGIVSYKKPTITRSVIIYTDVGYFYKWIKKNSVYLYCGEDLDESSSRKC